MIWGLARRWHLLYSICLLRGLGFRAATPVHWTEQLYKVAGMQLRTAEEAAYTVSYDDLTPPHPPLQLVWSPVIRLNSQSRLIPSYLSRKDDRLGWPGHMWVSEGCYAWRRSDQAEDIPGLRVWQANSRPMHRNWCCSYKFQRGNYVLGTLFRTRGICKWLTVSASRSGTIKVTFPDNKTKI